MEIPGFFVTVFFETLCCIIDSIHSECINNVRYTQKPCVARQMLPKRSVVCVCNATYCDTMLREQPVLGTYVSYTSSNSGLRFKKRFGRFEPGNQPCGAKLYVLDPYQIYQGIIGFGGAVTDTASYMWTQLSPGARQNLINSYFADSGSMYNIIRVPVGGTDFSLRSYSLNEYPEGDYKLSNYSLSNEDYEYKIPMILAAQKVASEKILVFGSTWSPPPWMKSDDFGASRLLLRYYQTYADYHCKFAEKYQENGIEMYGFTTTNEPLNGVFPIAKFQDLGWNSSGMGEYIQKYLSPTFRKCSAKNLKILAVDDQRTCIPIFFNALNEYSSEVINYVDGIAVHWYMNEYTPASMLSDILRQYPTKFILSTEACNGFKGSDTPKVDYGSWQRANNYIKDIMENLRNSVSGWMDWNLCLNTEGGPSWCKNYVDSPIIINPETDEFYKQPMYYALAHFSKFLPPGSRRIKVVSSFIKDVTSECYFYHAEEIIPVYDYVAFLTPRNTIVFIIQNTEESKIITIQLGEQQIVVTLEAESITTVEFPYPASGIYKDMPDYVTSARIVKSGK